MPVGLSTAIVTRLAMGLVFPIALMLIVVTGSDLFTGNVMYMAVGLLERKYDGAVHSTSS